MEYAVIETGGKQYRVSPGDVLEIDRVNTGGALSFDKVLLHVLDQNVKIGKPYISGLSVLAKVINEGKGKKIRVARFTAKSRHRRVIGFKPFFTRVQIEKISNAVDSKNRVSPKTGIKARAASK